MSYIFNDKKHNLYVGDFIVFDNSLWVVAEKYKTKVVLLLSEDIPTYKHNIDRGISHTGHRYKNCNHITKDIRELKGSEIF